jgi:hypothetical protein
MRPRVMLWPILVIGVALIVMPFAIGLPGKASHGQTMMDQFHPIMAPASVRTTVAYYHNTFTPLAPLASGGVQAAAEVPGMIRALSGALHMTPAQLEGFFAKNFPALGGLLSGLGKLVPVLRAVPAGLAHYRPLVRTMRANVVNYQQIDSLPNFRLFTWFFVIPGALIVALALAALAGVRGPAAGARPRTA